MHARLYYYDVVSKMLLYDGEDILLLPASVPDPLHPTLRFGDFDAIARCAGKTGQQLLYTIVSDRKFSQTDPTKPASDAGLTDTNHWELQCN
jgi:hypothetical protein